MKLFSKLTVVAAAAVSVLSAAEVIDLTSKDFWRPMKNVEFSEGQMINNSRNMFRSKKCFTFDPAKKYTIEMTAVGGEGKKSSSFFVGIYPATAKGALCSAYSIQTNPASYTEVAADAKKGDKVIKVKDASKWTKGGGIAFNAKADFSDLPNGQLYTGGIVSCVKDGDSWTITLKKALNRNVAARSFVRQHFDGGYNYLWMNSIAPGKTVNIKSSITGTAKQGRYTSKAFHPAVKHGYIIILADWYNAKTPVTIKNAKLTIE